ncbi:CmpA/NrtA family ABC transporter substrate-binding protein [Acetobacter thailandicus]|uniref:CmpA/NrtA family ABC transporter substrate-binding protein n=1 Tax=Acetobacter thailandicus TaxID=1502842 RepID=UPI001BAE052B|nr:CmpA/NrtA family ABC transporter substrate-binding protein [Acetobacter thailandicus]MBS0986457.1 ABC transporter substrate-binding protein [Acetobacter thailandicus]
MSIVPLSEQTLSARGAGACACCDTVAFTKQSSVITRRAVFGGITGATILGHWTPVGHAAPSLSPIEKPDLQIGFVPISCAAPLIMAHAKGFFSEEGLNVHLKKISGWALIRDRLLDGELDASHMLSPMPIALSLGMGNQPQPVRVLTMQNTNGQAITLALKHHARRDPRQWKGMKFAIPFEYSMHNLLLRAYLAKHGLDPDNDVILRVTSPPDMVANLRAGNIDGFLGPEPFNQRAVVEEVGFIHILTADIWDGHPCCAFGVTEAFISSHPNTSAALQRAMIRAAVYMQDPNNRVEAAQIMSRPDYVNQPKFVINQSLTGHYADGLGNVCNNLHRSGYTPFPYYSMALWIMQQMSRWGYLKQSVDYKESAESIFLLNSARDQARNLGIQLSNDRQGNYPNFVVNGEIFDPNRMSPFSGSTTAKGNF